MDNDSRKTIVLIDDDFVIRDVIKSLLQEFRIYSTDNGVEGLGYIYISKPSLIIIDTTLPKYGGLEVVEYISSNESLKNSGIPILVIHEEDTPPNLNYSNVRYLIKSDPDFINSLLKNVSELSGASTGKPPSGMKSSLGNRLIKLANKSDKVQRRIEMTKIDSGAHFIGAKVGNREMDLSKIPASNFFRWLYWVGLQVLISIFLTLYTILYGRVVKDENLPQHNSDSNRFRVRYYPTLITGIVSILFLLIQLFLFITGGIVIFNTRIESIFAVSAPEVVVDFSQSIFDQNEINFNGSSFSLLLKSEVVETPEVLENNQEESQSVDLPQDVVEPIQEEPVQNEDESTEETPPSEQTTPIEEEFSPSESEVLGAETSASYSTVRPSVIFNEGIDYSSIKSIKEESSQNTKDSSFGISESSDLSKKLRSEEDMKNLSLIHSQILNEKGELLTYQISPNGSEWYYFGSENRWELTSQGYVASNTIQELNQFVGNFNSLFPDSKLFIKVFFHSLGDRTPILNKLYVERGGSVDENLEDPISDDEVVEVLDPSLFDSDPISAPIVEENSAVEEESIDLPIPTLFQVSYLNGQKIIYGKVSGVQIPESIVDSLSVRAYFTTSSDLGNNSVDKGEYIGQSGLTLNSKGEYIFTIQEASRDGGFVAVELVYKDGNNEIRSILSRPLGD